MVKVLTQQFLISHCSVSTSLISCFLFSWAWILARSRLGTSIALGPNWDSLALIPALFPVSWGDAALEVMFGPAGLAECMGDVIRSDYVKVCCTYPLPTLLLQKLISVFLS